MERVAKLIGVAGYMVGLVASFAYVDGYLPLSVALPLGIVGAGILLAASLLGDFAQKP